MKVRTGDTVTFTKTIGAADLDQFVLLSGDDYEAHTDDDFMKDTPFGRRIVHGALLVGLMSAAGTKMIRAMKLRGDGTTPVALGYDRVRFVGPVFVGDTIAATYTVTEIDAERARSLAELTLANQAGKTVAVATHVMKWLEP